MATAWKITCASAVILNLLGIVLLIVGFTTEYWYKHADIPPLEAYHLAPNTEIVNTYSFRMQHAGLFGGCFQHEMFPVIRNTIVMKSPYQQSYVDRPVSCPSGQFMCPTQVYKIYGDTSMNIIKSDYCLPNGSKCDQKVDCLNKEDELGCQQKACPNGRRQCPNDGNICITQEQLCDGVDNCGDNADEMNCSSSCKAYLCSDGTCARRSREKVKGFRCDGQRDCRDGSDEASCNETCHMLMGIRCDGIATCSNLSDEKNCPEPKNKRHLRYDFSRKCSYRPYVYDLKDEEHTALSDEANAQEKLEQDTFYAAMSLLSATFVMWFVAIVLQILFIRLKNKIIVVICLFMIILGVLCVASGLTAVDVMMLNHRWKDIRLNYKDFHNNLLGQEFQYNEWYGQIELLWSYYVCWVACIVEILSTVLFAISARQRTSNVQGDSYQMVTK